MRYETIQKIIRLTHHNRMKECIDTDIDFDIDIDIHKHKDDGRELRALVAKRL